MLKLIVITEANHESIMEYKVAFIGNLKEVSRIVCMSTILGEMEYIEWLKRNKVENYYFMIDDNNPSYIIGDCTINKRGEYNTKGFISYSIRPNERCKHYGTHMLKLLLEKCREINIEEVNVSCLENNLASQKVIQNNGGKLDKRYFDIKACDYAFKYQISLDQTNKTFVKI